MVDRIERTVRQIKLLNCRWRRGFRSSCCQILAEAMGQKHQGLDETGSEVQATDVLEASTHRQLSYCVDAGWADVELRGHHMVLEIGFWRRGGLGLEREVLVPG